ncbi:acyl--CoA ligase family protein [soil metagenome]
MTSDPMRSFSYEPLTPTAFLRRAAYVYNDRPAVVDGDRTLTYAQFWDRSTRLAGALADLGIESGDRVAALAPNSTALVEAHNGVPLAGAVLVPMNTRQKAGELSYILSHSGARALIYDESLGDNAREAAEQTNHDVRLIRVGGDGDEYEELLDAAEPHEVTVDELDLLSINYTSGTTGQPKGVMYSHRGAYLQALAMAFQAQLTTESVYLWTLPMFHCDGWCFTWGISGAGATHLCLRAIDADEIWRLIREHGVTHMSAAPTVLNMVANSDAADEGPAPRTIHVDTGGAPPSPRLLSALADLNMEVTHLYGLTESYGPAMICQWQPEWSELDADEQAELRSRQGVANVVGERPRVLDDNDDDVEADGETEGEIALRGNNVMLGYYDDEEQTREATSSGWFRTGDVGVMHPNGYVELSDRKKDVIISGGENIASVEVEQTIETHDAVLEAAVVAKDDEKWGEVPVAFVTLRDGEELDADAVIAHVKERIANYKAPREVHFGELPKTSTGKLEKHVLRDRLDDDG